MHETVIASEEEEGINGREEKLNAALCITFIAVQEEKYQNQASGSCTRIHCNQRYKVSNAGLQNFWDILYCAAQQPTGLRQVTKPESPCHERWETALAASSITKQGLQTYTRRKTIGYCMSPGIFCFVEGGFSMCFFSTFK